MARRHRIDWQVAHGRLSAIEPTRDEVAAAAGALAAAYSDPKNAPLLGHDGIGVGHAELALLIAAPAAQGRGLGTRFAIMVHAFAFRTLGLERLYVAIVPGNQASRRLFARLGHRVDDSPIARAYVDDAGEVSMSIGRGEFEAAHAAALSEIRITERNM